MGSSLVPERTFMRIDVVGRNIEVTEAIRLHAEGKMGKLPKYFDGVQLLTLTVTKDDHKTHGQFGAELIIDVQGHDDFVCQAHGDDLYLLIDQVAQKGSRQLTDFKEMLKQGKR